MTSAQAHPAPGSFRIVAGEEMLRMWKPPDGGEKWFCGECGSAIYGSNPSHPESVGIRMGTFDSDPGIRPTVRGVAMNPIDHPHGGGEGRTSGGRHPVTPWGKGTKGNKTRKPKASDSLIVRSRHSKKKGR